MVIRVPPSFRRGRDKKIGILLNGGFVIAEVIYGILGNSIALLADAGHNLSDVLGLLLACGASVLVKPIPSNRFTYGLRSTSILAALINAVLLLIVTGGITVHLVFPEGYPSDEVRNRISGDFLEWFLGVQRCGRPRTAVVTRVTMPHAERG